MRISDWSSDVCSSDLEGTGPDDLVLIESDRASLEGLQRRLDFPETRVDVVGQFVGFGILLLELIVFGLQRIAGRFLLGGERDFLAAQLAEAEGVPVREVGSGIGPLPALGDNGLSLPPELVRHHVLDEWNILQPAAVVRLEQVTQHGAAGLDLGAHADELRTLVGGANGALGQPATERIGLLVVRLLQAPDNLFLSLGNSEQ